MDGRLCSRPTCRNYAERTLSYDYQERVMVVGPLSPQSRDGGFDLCGPHAERLRPPEGWTVVKHQPDPSA